MSDKIMLLDGHSLLNRAFYGLPDLTNAEGKHTNAVLGFLNIMLRYVISPISSCEMMKRRGILYKRCFFVFGNPRENSRINRR